ncbi:MULTISPECIES: alpha/beta hydrolase [Spirosoma]|uniref:Esterase family protein n=1 Tax=Spirosoma sordidisoli TaxID=2502893 RepID=A0A4V1RWX9_9BACT|nr:MULTISPECIES: alpha/beta hydrolase-fold protein [Spirosoma]RYC71828.1 esterase family protein [Spirosoma sordidisoli]
MKLRSLFLSALLLVWVLTAQAQSRRRSQLTGPQNNGPVPVVSAPEAHLLESLRLNSSLLNQAVKYSIYLPPDYYVSNRRYPVVYLLHGYTDNETGWVQFGEANRIVDEKIRSGELPPMIIVMPDAGVTWYMNDYLGKVRYEDMFVQEFIPHIDSMYRTRTQREYRAVSGLSMGGHGSLLLAMHHPDLFGSCAALSAAVFTEESIATTPDEQYDQVFAALFSGPVKGEERITTHFKRNSPLTLARSAPENDLKKVRWYMDCGDDDFLSAANAQLHIELLKRKIPHEYRVRDGAHTWTYWRTGLPDALSFIARSFQRD